MLSKQLIEHKTTIPIRTVIKCCSIRLHYAIAYLTRILQSFGATTKIDLCSVLLHCFISFYFLSLSFSPLVFHCFIQVVQLRNEVIESLEMDRRREAEEDQVNIIILFLPSLFHAYLTVVNELKSSSINNKLDK